MLQLNWKLGVTGSDNTELLKRGSNSGKVVLNLIDKTHNCFICVLAIAPAMHLKSLEHMILKLLNVLCLQISIKNRCDAKAN